MPKIKKVYTKGYTVIDNTILDDEKLTLKAKGLFAILWSRNDNWHFYVSEITKHSKGGRDQVMSGLDELEEHGYLNRSRKRNALGQLTSENDWLLSETPIKSWIDQKQAANEKKATKKVAKKNVEKSVDKSAQPKSENPTLDKPTLENPTLTNTNQNKYLLDKALTSNLSLTPSCESNARLVDKAPAEKYERENKADQIIFILNQKAQEWRTEVPPVSKSQRKQLVKAVGSKRLQDIIPCVETAVINASTYPFGYMLSMIKNLPEDEHVRSRN